MKAKEEIQNKGELSKQLLFSPSNLQNYSSSLGSLNKSKSELPDYLNFKEFLIDDQREQENNSSQSITSADFKGQEIESKGKSYSTQNIITANICNNTFQNNQFNGYFPPSAYFQTTYYGGTYLNPYPVYYVPGYLQPLPMMIPNFQTIPVPPVKIVKSKNLKEISKSKTYNLLKYIKENEISKIKSKICSSEGCDFLQNLVKEASPEEITDFIIYIEFNEGPYDKPPWKLFISSLVF